ncbi:hypothetical protein I4U23_028258 [Adineta vaga]|nr:hypothetical protein I4U23_028258 [Adineta vaga]
MAARNYFDRTLPRNSLGGFYTSASLTDNRGAYSLPSRRFGQHYLHDTNLYRGKAFSSSSSSSSFSTTQPPHSSITADSYSGHVRERSISLTRSPSFSQMSSPHYQSSLDLVAASLKCDDCRTNDGLFQCCHCDQRLCIQCCNKHYKSITVELERLHELSDRLVAKILHAKNDLERQKNEALEQCHKWRVDTINTINKAHTLIVQTVHDEYETLGKEYESFVQQGMTHIHVDQNELMRMKKSNLGSLLSAPSTDDSTNAIDTIRRRIETFAKTVDETGKFSFQVKLPIFYIDDSLRVETRFGDVSRSTSATWKNDDTMPTSLSKDRCETIKTQESRNNTDVPTEKPDKTNDNSLDNDQKIKPDVESLPLMEEFVEDKKSFEDIQPNETEILLTDDKNDIMANSSPQIIEISDKSDLQECDMEPSSRKSYSLPSSPRKSELNDKNVILRPSSRYALSVENNVELQQQQYYSPTSCSENYDNSPATTISSPNRSSPNPPDHSLSVALHDPSFKRRSCPINNGSGTFHNHRHQNYSFPRNTSPSFQNNDNEDAFRSISYVQLKREQDGSLEGIAIQIEQSQQTNGKVQRRRTCMESCGVRRRATILPPRCPSSTRERSSNDQCGLSYRNNSTPASIN